MTDTLTPTQADAFAALSTETGGHVLPTFDLSGLSGIAIPMQRSLKPRAIAPVVKNGKVRSVEVSVAWTSGLTIVRGSAAVVTLGVLEDGQKLADYWTKDMGQNAVTEEQLLAALYAEPDAIDSPVRDRLSEMLQSSVLIEDASFSDLIGANLTAFGETYAAELTADETKAPQMSHSRVVFTPRGHGFTYRAVARQTKSGLRLSARVTPFARLNITK